MKLDLIFLFFILRSLFILLAIFFPILYLADFISVHTFTPFNALMKVVFRYGQSLSTLILWSVWMAVRKMRSRYSDMAFVSIGFRPKDAWRLMLCLSLFFMAFDAFIIIPSNKILFPEKIIQTNWSIKKISYMDEKKDASISNMAFIYKKNNNIEIWQADEEVSFLKAKLSNGKVCFLNSDKKQYAIKLDKDDFFVLWNEPRQLSWSGLKAYKKYMEHNEINTNDVLFQINIFLSRIALILPMIIFGFAFGWQKNVSAMIICSVFSNWLNQMIIFLPFFEGIFSIWFNVILWLVIGCFYL